MKNFKLLLLGVLGICLFASNAFALAITTSASGTLFSDNYSYDFTIDDGNVDNGIYRATLTNTSTASAAGALIDLFAFNINAVMDSDFTIANISPDWGFYEGSGGVRFDYLGQINAPTERLTPGDSLVFDFVFDPVFDDSFDLWTLTDDSRGTGIGGGDDIGQVAVSFQQLGGGGYGGSAGDGSDLLASNWSTQPPPPAPVPEPATMMLLGTGLVGLAGIGRRKFGKK